MKDVCLIHNVWYNLEDKCPECNKEVKVPIHFENYIPNQKIWRVVKGLALAALVYFTVVVLGAVLLHSK